MKQKHNLTIGYLFRRLDQDSTNYQNARGSFAFSGLVTSQLTAGETSRLENREAAIHHEVRADRAANGGRLTAGERAQVNRQQNRVSRSIYVDKHTGARQ